MESHSFEKRIKRQIKGREHQFFAVVEPGFENVAMAEFKTVGVDSFENKTVGGFEFSCKMDFCYALNLASRTVTRILWRVHFFNALDFFSFNKKMNRFPWELYLYPNSKRIYKVTAHKSKLYHTVRIADEAESAIVNRLNDIYDKSEIVYPENRNAEQIVFIRIDHNHVTISLDTSGEPLYKRGRKKFVADAPLRETIATKILLESNFEKYDEIWDLMSGSGTFSIEAFEMINGILANGEREFPFFYWPSFREKSFLFLKKKIEVSLSDLYKKVAGKMKIIAADIDEKNIEIIKNNFEHAGIEDGVVVMKNNFFDSTSSLKKEKNIKALLVLNPPYGKRLDVKEAISFYKNIMDKIKNDYFECGYAIIIPSKNIKNLPSLKYDKKLRFKNGGIDVTLIIKNNFRIN